MHCQFNFITPFHCTDEVPSWQRSIQEYLEGKGELLQQKMIDQLMTNSELKKLYQMPISLDQNLTVEVHTRMVVDSFAKEFVNVEKYKVVLEDASVGERHFFIFLALHAIGRGKAYEEVGHALSFKEKDLQYTREVFQQMAPQLSIENDTLNLFLALLQNDTIEEALAKGAFSQQVIDRAADKIDEAARLSSLNVLTFFDLAVLFHQVNAAVNLTVRQYMFQTIPGEVVMLHQTLITLLKDYNDANQGKITKLKSALIDKELGTSGTSLSDAFSTLKLDSFQGGKDTSFEKGDKAV